MSSRRSKFRARPWGLAVVIWVLTGSALSLAPGLPPASPTHAATASQSQTPSDAALREPSLTATELGLRAIRVRDRLLWVQDGVAPDRADWIAGAWQLGAALIPELLGYAPPRDPLSIYVFADQPEFQRLTSRLTGLAPTVIQPFEGGRAFASGAQRGIYVNASALAAPEDAARLVVHELVHLVERDAVGTRSVPAWFSEGIAEYVGQAAMARVDALASAQRRWRREVLVASALHLDVALPLSALESSRQWSDAVSAGYERRAYATALAAVDRLVARAGDEAPRRVLQEIARGATFAAALETVAGLAPASLDPTRAEDFRTSLLARHPVGVHVFPAEGPPGTRFQFAGVGLMPGEVLTRQFVREDGRPASASGAPGTVAPSGAAFWTFQTRPHGEPANWTVIIEGDRGTRATRSFRVMAPATAPVDTFQATD